MEGVEPVHPKFSDLSKPVQNNKQYFLMQSAIHSTILQGHFSLKKHFQLFWTNLKLSENRGALH